LRKISAELPRRFRTGRTLESEKMVQQVPDIWIRGSGLRALALALIPLLVLSLVSGCASSPPKLTADQVVVIKSERRLQLLHRGNVVREYRVALGDNPIGHKLEEGDERTPIGDYFLDWRNPNSQFYKSIHVSYPNERDRLFARAIGIEAGGLIMIHGKPNYITSPAVLAEYDRRDWTDGCIAVTNEEMDEIWGAVSYGTPIRILP
jgi:murein L,D-transpeptidase YafK